MLVSRSVKRVAVIAEQLPPCAVPVGDVQFHHAIVIDVGHTQTAGRFLHVRGIVIDPGVVAEPQVGRDVGKRIASSWRCTVCEGGIDIVVVIAAAWVTISGRRIVRGSWGAATAPTTGKQQ